MYFKTSEISPNHEWVVFFHGLGGNSSIWYKQIKDFKKHYNLLFIDLRGHGKSKNNLKELSQYTLTTVGQDVIEVMDHLNIKTAHFVGISLGSIIMNRISLFAPSRISSMVLGGAIARFNLRSKVLIEIGDIGKAITPYMWLYRFFAWILMPNKDHAYSRNMFVREAEKLGQKEFIKWYKLTKEVEPLFNELRRNEVPIPKFYIAGKGDHMFLPILKHEVKRDKYASLHVIDECGHVCNIDQPEEFNKHVIKFLKNTSAVQKQAL
ncbi:alpha/beta fold hydrolase [Anaerobacillus sp. MEB173]|uniref:alpha/beta fold hydrolase n=1 Tax=Anaerobacillus sp. MEB173 TaxID=3383345 RepID=UPI003F93F1E0